VGWPDGSDVGKVVGNEEHLMGAILSTWKKIPVRLEGTPVLFTMRSRVYIEFRAAAFSVTV
jgi:hypothetical protein